MELAEVKEYLGPQVSVFPDVQIQDALDAETTAQADLCNVPETANAALDEALKRRVARNLAMRNAPLSVQNDGEGAIRVGGYDPEIKRLEGPYRKVFTG